MPLKKKSNKVCNKTNALKNNNKAIILTVSVILTTCSILYKVKINNLKISL